MKIRAAVTRLASVCCLFLLVLCPVLRAQFTSGVEGSVADSSQGAIPEVKLDLTNTETGVTLSTLTNSSGRFRFIELAPGRYTLKATKTGFRSAVQQNIVLESGRIQDVPMTLEVGAVTQEVLVQADVAPVETTNPKISAVVTNEYVNNIPTGNRNIYNLIALAPGVTGITNQPGTTNDAFNTITGTTANANGARVNSNGYYVDGSPVNDMADGGGAKLTPNPDSVEEVRVTTNDYSAQYGKNSGILTQVVTKTGTNQLHGSMFWYHRDNALAARTYLQNTINPATGRIFPAYRRNEAGFSLGGPVRKDKTFLFGTFDKLISSNATSSLVTVETPDLVNWMKTNYPNNISTMLVTKFTPYVPGFTSYRTVSQLTTGGCTGINSIGLPCSLNAFGTGVFSAALTHNGLQWNIRGDQLFGGGKDRLYGNIYRTRGHDYLPSVRDFNAAGGFDQPVDFYQDYYALNETHTFSPSMFNEAAFSMYYTENGSPCNNCNIPNVNVTGISGFGPNSRCCGSWAPAVFLIHDWNWSDIISLNRGTHFFKAGVQFSDDQENLKFTGPLTRPTFNFTGATALFDFIQDNPFQETGINFDPRSGSTTINNNRDFRFAYWAAFFQDDWKVKPNLTINWGLRWETNTNPIDKANEMTNIVFGQGSEMYTRLQNASIQGLPALLNGVGRHYFAPRLGIAWDPTKTGKLSIRAGSGVFYDTFTTKTTFDINQSNPPYFSSITAQRGISPAPIFAIGTSASQPFNFPLPGLGAGLNPGGGPINARAGISGEDPNLKFPYSVNTFAGFQYAVTPKWVVEADYHNARGVHLFTYWNDKNRCNGCGTTRINPYFAGIQYIDNSGASMYHGATFQVRHLVGAGLSMQLAYSIGKAMGFQDSTSGGTGSTRGPIIDAWNLRRQYGLAEFDVPQRIAASFVYNIPGPHISGFTGALLRGWEFSGIITAQKGYPQTVTDGAYDFNNDLTFYDVPDAPTTKFGGWSRSDYVNGTTLAASAFPLPPKDANGNFVREGNLGRTTYRGPGFAQTDLAFHRNFKIPWFLQEKANLQLRWQAYNAFNRVNPNGWVTDINSATFGKTTGSYIPRTMEITARLTF